MTIEAFEKARELLIQKQKLEDAKGWIADTLEYDDKIKNSKKRCMELDIRTNRGDYMLNEGDEVREILEDELEAIDDKIKKIMDELEQL